MKAWSVKNGAGQHCFGSHDKMHDNDAEGCMKRPSRENISELRLLLSKKTKFVHFNISWRLTSAQDGIGKQINLGSTNLNCIHIFSPIQN